MNTVQFVDINRIDPNSTINVRRQGVEDNVEKVKSSIQQHGYWPDQPIIVRPHPDIASDYDYENVTGQCRLKACLQLDLKEIPAFVLELDDDEAIQRSWLENEMRGDLTPSDKAYWTEKIYKRYSGDGYTADEAIGLAAKYLGVKVDAVMGYYRLAVLPESVMDMVDKGILPQKLANPLVRYTYDANRIKESKKAMEDRTSWLLSLDRDSREHAVKALAKLGHKASIADLSAEVSQRNKESKRFVQYAIPMELYDDLLEWGLERGLESESEIIGRMIGDTLRR